MKKNIFFVFCFIILVSTFSFAEDLHLVPWPQEVTRLDSVYRFSSENSRIAIEPENDSDIQFAAKQLQQEIKNDAEIDIKITDQDNPSAQILLTLMPNKKTIKELKENGLVLDEKLGDEGYVLFVQPKKIIIAAKTSSGVFYGVQTLKQLVRVHIDKNRIPCVAVRDWPTLQLRGVSDDISRGPIPTMEFFKECIRRYAELKINMLNFYTENVVRTKKHGCFAPSGALTLEQIRELSGYAKKYHIDLVGCFQSFGHFEKILEYPQYEHLGEMGSLLSPAYKESYQLLADIYSELVPVYPSPYFTVLCDELWALGKGASEKMVAEKGRARVFADHVNWIHDELGKYNKKILVTADEPLQHPDMFDLMKKDIILLPWDYSGKESFSDMLQPIADHGFNFLVTTGVNGWRKTFPVLNESLVNIKNFVRDGVRYNALGMLNTTWDEWGSGFFTNNWYGIAYGADQGWHSENSYSDDFGNRFSAAIYGDKSATVYKVIKTLTDVASIPPLRNYESTVFFSRLFPDVGLSAQLSILYWNDLKAAGEKALQLLQKSPMALYSKDMLYLRYAADQLIFMADYRMAVLQTAEYYRQACLNQNDKDACRNYLLKSIELLSSIRQRWQGLEEQHKNLWLLENRSYWLENIVEQFQLLENDLDDVIGRLTNAYSDFEKGIFLPSPARVRLAVKELKGNFFQTWLLCGSFPNPKDNPDAPSHSPACVGFRTDYLTAIGGETNAKPTEGLFIQRPDKSQISWKMHTTNLGAKIDLKNLFDFAERSVAYAYCEIMAPENMTVKAALGSNDGVKVFLNGRLLHEKHELRFVKIDEDVVDFSLQKGTNRVLLKIDQGRGKWGFVFRLKDVPIENRGNLYTIKEE